MSDSDDCELYGPWPAIIFAIFMVVILIGIAFTSYVDTTVKAWTFFLALAVAILGFAIIYWFCSVRMHAIAWFLLFIPLGIYIVWSVSYWIAKVTVPEDCVLGKNN